MFCAIVARLVPRFSGIVMRCVCHAVACRREHGSRPPASDVDGCPDAPPTHIARYPPRADHGGQSVWRGHGTPRWISRWVDGSPAHALRGVGFSLRPRVSGSRPESGKPTRSGWADRPLRIGTLQTSRRALAPDPATAGGRASRRGTPAPPTTDGGLVGRSA